MLVVVIELEEEKPESDLRDRFDWRLSSGSLGVSLQMRKSGVGVVSLKDL